MSQPGPAQYGPPPGGMGAAPQQGGFAPQPPPSSGNATIGWVIGGIAAVLVIVAGIAGVIFFANAGNSEDSGTDGGSSSASDSSAGPSQTPTDVVNDYYDAVRAHDVDGAYKTLCSSMQGSESDFFGSYDEDEFWKTVDASTYTVGEETIKDDSNANVKVKQEVQGETYDFSADLQIESGEWKICYWNTPT
ncbi:putative periplasmic ligand-binding sensor protein [Stackebrandtia nassauensis DSM 44728]|uniref:Putative periplasmic ligand-binding sensor protein n=2 Tax=Stackebrandtia TaxID=283810 RepID=D3QA27_STANL|nr:putative periplasmic ligand-binding sensor protein [Stackebrandtia nassauensis DSM 44728]